MTIKQKFIIAFLVISLIPMLIIGSLFFDKSRTALMEARIAELESIADLKVSMLEEIMSNLRKDMEVAQDYWNIKTNLPVLTRLADDTNDPAYIQARKNLDSQLKPLIRIKGLEDFMLTSPEGIVLYMTNESHMGIDFNQRLPDKMAFEEGKKGIYFSEIIKTKSKRTDYEMLVTAPLHDRDGAFIGVVVFEVDMALIYQLMQDTTGLGDTGETLIGRNMGDHALFLNPTLYDPDAALKRKAMFGNPNAYPIQEAVQGRNNGGISFDYRGEEILAVWRHVPSMNWGLVAKIDTSEAFQSIVALRNLTLMTGIIVLLIMPLIAIFIARTLSKPIQNLKDGIALIGKGNLDHKVGTESKDEIGQLSRAFDEMTGNLKSATASRDEFEREIAERKQAEAKIEIKTRELELRGRYDQSYAQAMALFSATYNQEKALIGLLSIMADNHPFPVSAIYTYDEWSGNLKLAASHGAPESLQVEFNRGKGVIGQAALENKHMILDGADEGTGFVIEAGLFEAQPAAVLIYPVCYQEKVVGVLALASTRPLLELDVAFIERLCSQLGVAMNNLKQHSDLVNLSEQLRQKGEEIARQNEQLEQSNRMKSEFLANMSHELRTPLNAIIGFSEVLKDGVMGELNDEQTEYIGDIFNSGQHLLSLINDILDLSKIEAGKMELDIESIDVPELLENSLSIIKEKAMAHRLKLKLDVAKNVASCALDGRKVKQIVYNLLSNAVKFTPDGGRITLSANLTKGENLQSGSSKGPIPLSIPPSLDMDFVEITVSDTGIGISKEDQQRLFQAFVQADGALNRKYEGTGLGLVMIKRLAELHGGAVGLFSKEGKGSAFTTWLPYQGGGAAVIRPARQPRSSAFVTPKGVSDQLVLIVEDDDKAAELMRVQLVEGGYRTMRAASGEAALEMMAEHRPDLITLDIIMPGMGGWNFLSEIKNHKKYSSIPVVIVSIVADEKKGFSLGASRVLQKPVGKANLLAAVKEVSLLHRWSGEPVCALVVDDDPKAVDIISRRLEGDGHSVHKAYGGQEAIDITFRKKPNLIILDLMMPEVNGFDVVMALKAKAETKDIPIIILTAKVITKEDRKKLNGDVLTIVEKSSFNHGVFINEVHRAIGNPARKGET